MEVSIEHFDQFLSEVSLAVVADLVLEVFYEKLLFQYEFQNIKIMRRGRTQIALIVDVNKICQEQLKEILTFFELVFDPFGLKCILEL